MAPMSIYGSAAVVYSTNGFLSRNENGTRKFYPQILSTVHVTQCEIAWSLGNLYQILAKDRTVVKYWRKDARQCHDI